MWVLVMAIIWSSQPPTSITSIRFNSYNGCVEAKRAMASVVNGKYHHRIYAVCVEDK